MLRTTRCNKTVADRLVDEGGGFEAKDGFEIDRILSLEVTIELIASIHIIFEVRG